MVAKNEGVLYMVRTQKIRELPEDFAQYDVHFANIGAAAGHSLIRKVDADNADYIVCECDWESKHYPDNMTGPFTDWITHSRSEDVQFGKELLAIWHEHHGAYEKFSARHTSHRAK
jgi:hypothetical protein